LCEGAPTTVVHTMRKRITKTSVGAVYIHIYIYASDYWYQGPF
jgi:hypothetical protein